MATKHLGNSHYQYPTNTFQFVGILFFLVLLSLFIVLGVLLVRLESERYNDRQYEQVQRTVEELRLNLRSRIYANLYKISSLNALIALNPELTQDDFSRAMAVQFQGEQDLRNIGLAREMILTLMYPIEGNEAAIGLDYRTVPDQLEAVELALELNTIVLAGPVNLVQGGQGFIARVPLYIPRHQNQEQLFWGFASVVINSESILKGSGLVSDHPFLELAIRGRDGKGPDGEVFWGNPAIFNGSPVNLPIELPYGSWQLAGIPIGGWSTYNPFSYLFIWLYLAIVIVILGFTVLIFHLIANQKKATIALELERNLFAAGPVFTMEWNPESKERWHVKSFSSNVPEILGYSPDTLALPDFSYNDIIHPEDLEIVLNELRSNIETNVNQFEQSYRIKKSDGQFIWLYDFTQLIRDSSGKLLSLRSYMYDQTKQIQTQEALKVAQEQLEKTAFELTEHIPVGTYTMIQPPEGGIAKFGFMSKKFLELTGLTRESALADPMNAFRCIHPEDYDDWVTLNVKTFQEKSHFYSEARILLEETIHWIEAESSPRVLPDGSTVWEGVVVDITRRKQAEEELRNAIEVAEQASEAKSEFLANMSHEIRTPLNGIIGFTDLLSQTPLSTTQKQYVEYAHVAGQSLLGVINDILDFSKIEAGMMELELVQTNMIEFFEQTIDVISYNASLKQLEVILDLDPKLPKFAQIDPVRLRQVLINLLGNATKFTTQGEIELSVRFTPLEEDRGSFRIRVRDTGIGISPDQKEKLFKAFSQADSSTTRKFGGTGLGLIISKHLVEKMGGLLDFTSQLDKGTSFQFSFTTKIHGISTPQLTALKPIRNCLIIDGNDSSGRVLKQILDSWNIESQVFSSTQAGTLTIQTNQDFDLVFLDYSMPEINRMEFLTNLRSSYGLGPESLPVVMIHSSSDEVHLNQNNNTAAIHSWLVKPIKQHQLYTSLTQIASWKKLNSSLRQKDEVINLDNTDSPTNPHSDTLTIPQNSKQKTILIAEDVPMNMVLIQTVIKSFLPGIQILEAGNGDEAVELFCQHSPDLILMDIQMPVTDGLDATRKIRSLQARSNTRTPIIALTAGALKEEMDKCFTAGMDDFLTKPIDREVVIEKLQRYI